MSVLIKGMEMPKYCYTCPAYDYIHSTCCVLHTEVKDLDDKRYKDCPLVEVPTPHGRLIDADELKKDRINYGTTDVVLMVDIENAPTIIEAEVSE